MKFEIPDKFFNAEELKNTPGRWNKWMQEWLIDSHDFKLTTFKNPGYNQMITWVGSDYSMCSHHLAAIFLEKVVVAYIPDKTICGLSKIPKVISMFAHGPQIQERLTQQIADYLFDKLKCKGVFVWIKGKHLCVASRSTKQEGYMITTALKGIFHTDSAAKAEALSLCH